MGDITKNFSYYEYRPKGELKSWKPNSFYQRLLITKLAENMQVVRNNVPQGAYMKITSGVRLLSDYQRLVDAGYHPSQTSDHNCGVAIPLKPGTAKFKKYGETYNFAVGAADVVSVGMEVWDLFKLSFRLTKEGMCNFGQVIYEKNPANGSEWVHYGNILDCFFEKPIIDMINRTQFLQTLNGGKTYSVINSIQ